MVNLDERSKLISELRLEIKQLKEELQSTQFALLNLQQSSMAVAEVCSVLNALSHTSCFDPFYCRPNWYGKAHDHFSFGDLQVALPTTTTENDDRIEAAQEVLTCPTAARNEEEDDDGDDASQESRHDMDDGLGDDVSISTNSLSATRLKRELVDTVTFLKQVLKSKDDLQQRLEAEASAALRREQEMRQLYEENSSLREKVELLEYTVGCSEAVDAHRDPLSYIHGKCLLPPKGRAVNVTVSERLEISK